MKSQKPRVAAKSFREFRELLLREEEGMELLIFSRLNQGDVWSIPDEVTKFGDKAEHPWVVVKNYKKPSFVEVSPRTTTFHSRDDGKREIVTPASVITGLNKEGLILLRHKIKLTAEEFKEYRYLDRLPEVWIEKIRTFQRKLTEAPRK